MRTADLAELLNAARDRYATEHGWSASALADMRLAQKAARVRRDRIPAVTVIVTVAWVVGLSAYAAGWGRSRRVRSARPGATPREALAGGIGGTLLCADLLRGDPFHLLFNMVGFVMIGVRSSARSAGRGSPARAWSCGIAAMGLAVLLSSTPSSACPASSSRSPAGQ